MVAYPAILDVPRELVTFLAGLLAEERRARGTRPGTRALSCGKQALFALVWFRERRDVALIGRGLGISQATSYRYLHEAFRNTKPRISTTAGHIALVTMLERSSCQPVMTAGYMNWREEIHSVLIPNELRRFAGHHLDCCRQAAELG
ncbi:MAG: hypothetical protein ACRDSL_00065 [Pseudonocardiaceae bacterium]